MVINLTPHDIDVICADGTKVTIPKSGQVARVAQTNTPTNVGVSLGNDHNAELHVKAYSDIRFPRVPENTYVIVSALVQNACVELAKRTFAYAVPTDDGGSVQIRHILAPGEPVRDESGAIVACRGFVVHNIA